MRKMTDKGFLHKASGKVSASAFLAAHREFLETGTLAELTSPILSMLDRNEMLPTPALGVIKQAVMEHMISLDIEKGKASMQEAKVTKHYTATVLDSKHNVVVEQDFNDSVSATSWVDRKMYNGSSSWTASITHNVSERIFTIDHTDSIARFLKQSVGPVVKVSKGYGGRSNKMKAKGDHFHFSKG